MTLRISEGAFHEGAGLVRFIGGDVHWSQSIERARAVYFDIGASALAEHGEPMTLVIFRNGDELLTRMRYEPFVEVWKDALWAVGQPKPSTREERLQRVKRALDRMGHR